MYSELAHFARRVFQQPAIWKDGDLWTAVLGGVGSGIWFHYDPVAVEKVRQHFGDLLTVTGIVFGFVLAALTFYIQAASVWAKKIQVQAVANKLVDWHVWSIVCLLFQLGYIFLLWGPGRYIRQTTLLAAFLYGLLAFLVLYNGGQILNHALTVWWAFQNRKALQTTSPRPPADAGKP